MTDTPKTDSTETIPRIGPPPERLSAYAAGLMHGLEAVHRSAERMTRMMAWGFLVYPAGALVAWLIFDPFTGIGTVSPEARIAVFLAAFLVGIITPAIERRIAMGTKRPRQPVSTHDLERAIRRLGFSGAAVLGLAELPVLMGAVLFLFSGSWADLAPLLLIGYLFLWLHRPRYAAWRAHLARQFPDLLSRRTPPRPAATAAHNREDS